MTDSRAVRRARQIVLAAQSLSLLSVVLIFVVHLWWLTLGLAVISGVLVVAVVISRPVAAPLLRWLAGLGAAGIAAALFSLWLIRDEEAAIPIGQVGGLFLALIVTVVVMFSLVSRSGEDATRSV